MALMVANWTDKQLDELADLLHASDYSAVAGFISENFLCSDALGGRIMTDPTPSQLRVTVDGTTPKSVDLSPGIFQVGNEGKHSISQVESTQIINLLDPTAYCWGGTGTMGKAASADRWDIICVKNKSSLNTPENRWFVDDTVDPNTYSKEMVNTLINKADYDIHVVHGENSGGVPATPGGYWTIAEIFVDHTSPTAILPGNIYDTTGISQAPTHGGGAENWSDTTRVLRMEFWSTLFGIDHYLTGTNAGHHKSGGWHIGSTQILVTGDELNRALSGAGITVTAGNLTTLTNGSVLPPGVLHSHGGNLNLLATAVRLLSLYNIFDWTDIDVSSYVPVGAKQVYVLVEMFENANDVNTKYRAFLRKKGSTETNYLPRVFSYAHANGSFTLPGVACGAFFVDLYNYEFQVKWDGINVYDSRPVVLPANSYLYVDLLGYIGG